MVFISKAGKNNLFHPRSHQPNLSNIVCTQKGEVVLDNYIGTNVLLRNPQHAFRAGRSTATVSCSANLCNTVNIIIKTEETVLRKLLDIRIGLLDYDTC